MSSALMLPTAPFTAKDPEGWFRQLEAIFTLSEIEEDNIKYMHLQARMDPNVLRGVAEFFADEPATGKYTALKAKIISKHTESRDSQVLQLLEGLSLGDRRPSELLGEIRRLAASDLSEKVVRTMFLKKLPENLGSILAGSNEDLVNLGALADQIYAFQRSNAGPQISTIAPTMAPSHYNINTASEMNQIKAMLASLVETNIKLSARLTALETEKSFRTSRSTERSSSPGYRRRSTSGTKMPEDSKLCYYHYTYMGKAKRCKALPDGTPCKWSALNS